MTGQTAKMRPVWALMALILTLLPSLALAQYMDMMTLVGGIASREFYRDADRVSSVNAIRVERISSLPGAQFGRRRLDRMLDAYPEAQRYLHEQLRFNPIAARDIRAQGFEIVDIVYLVVAGDGGTTVYADDLGT
jgi:hypothetical protein